LDFYIKAEEFLAQMVAELDQTGLLIEIEEIDHLCLRVSTLEEYEFWKVRLLDFGAILTESFINGRPIAVFKLRRTIKSGNYAVDLIELPAPKPGRSYKFGFEHIEAVCKFPLENLLARRSDLSFVLDNFLAATNRDLQLRLPAGLIKFHEQNLAEVIKRESTENQKKISSRLAIFDFDDTLINSKTEFLTAIRRALSLFFRREVGDEECLQKARHTFPDFFANFAIENSKDVQEVLQLFKLEWEKVSNNIVLPLGIHTLLSCLYSEGVELIVWTARDLETTLACLKRLQVDHFFSHVFAFDPTSGSKPLPPESLQKLVKHRNFTLVGDSITDLTAAKNLGAKFFQAGWIQTKSLETNTDSKCDSPLACLERLLSFFDKI
jgi:predicted metalloenzyme YecM/phosphoglycolate phosphatase-like HAD superfamily hydrolase